MVYLPRELPGRSVISNPRGLLRTDGAPANEPVVVPGVTSDPDDDYLVALARENNADGIVSGIPHLHNASERRWSPQRSGESAHH